MKAGDVVTLRRGETRYVIEPLSYADEFCVPVVRIADEETGQDRRLVLAEDVHLVSRAG